MRNALINKGAILFYTPVYINCCHSFQVQPYLQKLLY